MKATKAKELKKYLSLKYQMILREEGGGYSIEFPELPGCVAYGDDIRSALDDAKAAKKAWIKIALSLGRQIPVSKEEEEYSGRFSLRLTKELHKTLTEQAKLDGRSLNQHIFILLSDLGRQVDQDMLMKEMEALKKKVEELSQKFEIQQARETSILVNAKLKSSHEVECKKTVGNAEESYMIDLTGTN